MSFEATALIACLVTIALGTLATQPEELREYRWLKVAVSLPPVWVISWASADLNRVNACVAAFSFGALGFIWKAPIAHAGSLLFVRLLHGDMNRTTTGFRAEFGAARALRKHGDLDDAMRHTRAELEKDPFNYEGLLLLAQLQIDLDQPDRALQTVALILEKTPLTDDQRGVIVATRKTIEDSLLIAK